MGINYRAIGYVTQKAKVTKALSHLLGLAFGQGPGVWAVRVGCLTVQVPALVAPYRAAVLHILPDLGSLPLGLAVPGGRLRREGCTGSGACLRASDFVDTILAHHSMEGAFLQLEGVGAYPQMMGEGAYPQLTGEGAFHLLMGVVAFLLLMGEEAFLHLTLEGAFLWQKGEGAFQLMLAAVAYLPWVASQAP